MLTRLLAILSTCASIAFAQTTGAITADDARARLSVFAHDSMEGRATGTRGHVRATDYIARELERLSLVARGETRSFFQQIPLIEARVDSGALAIDAARFRFGVEYVPVPSIGGMPFRGGIRAFRRDMVFAGRYGEGGAATGTTIGFGKPSDGGDFENKIVVVEAPVRQNGQPDYQVWADPSAILAYKGVAAVLIAALDVTPRGVIERFTQPWLALHGRPLPAPDIPAVVLITRATAMQMRAGRGLGATVNFGVRSAPLAQPARNVIAMVEGSDPRLKSEFVVLSAHTDHLGIADISDRAASDSVFNGANAGSGAMALLEIAEYVSSLEVKPKRSMLFVWMAASEHGLLGSEWFAEHPTVDRDDIVANINVDRIGRGALRGAMESVFDVPELALPCSGDHWHFARRGIPAATLAGDRDLDDRGLADDSAEVDYEAYTSNTRRLAAFAMAVAERPRLAKAKGNPDAVCM